MYRWAVNPQFRVAAFLLDRVACNAYNAPSLHPLFLRE